MDVLIHTANILYAVSYFVGDALRLRVYAVVAGVCLTGYMYYRPDPLMAAVGWNAFFVGVNLWWVVRLVRSRRRPGARATRSASRPARTASFSVARMAGCEP